jgi:hypothetical protein
MQESRLRSWTVGTQPLAGCGKTIETKKYSTVRTKVGSTSVGRCPGGIDCVPRVTVAVCSVPRPRSVPSPWQAAVRQKYSTYRTYGTEVGSTSLVPRYGGTFWSL